MRRLGLQYQQMVSQPQDKRSGRKLRVVNLTELLVYYVI